MAVDGIRRSTSKPIRGLRLTRFFLCGECGKRPKTALPGRLHRDAARSSTVRSLDLTEERYLPGDEALLPR